MYTEYSTSLHFGANAKKINSKIKHLMKTWYRLLIKSKQELLWPAIYENTWLIQISY